MFNKYPREMLEDRSLHPGSQPIHASDWLRTDAICILIGPICQLFCVTLIVNCSHVTHGKTRIKNVKYSGAVNHRNYDCDCWEQLHFSLPTLNIRQREDPSSHIKVTLEYLTLCLPVRQMISKVL